MYRKIEFENFTADFYAVRFNEQGFTKIDGLQGQTTHTPYFVGKFKGFVLYLSAPKMRVWQLKTPNGFYAGLANPFNNEDWKGQFAIDDSKVEGWLRHEFGYFFLPDPDKKQALIFCDIELQSIHNQGIITKEA